MQEDQRNLRGKKKEEEEEEKEEEEKEEEEKEEEEKEEKEEEEMSINQIFNFKIKLFVIISRVPEWDPGP